MTDGDADLRMKPLNHPPMSGNRSTRVMTRYASSLLSVAAPAVIACSDLRQLARLFGTGYLRLLAQRSDAQRAVPAEQESPISVDSCGQQSDELDRQRGNERR